MCGQAYLKSFPSVGKFLSSTNVSGGIGRWQKVPDKLCRHFPGRGGVGHAVWAAGPRRPKRNVDSHFIHANIDTDVIVAAAAPRGRSGAQMLVTAEKYSCRPHKKPHLMLDSNQKKYQTHCKIYSPRLFVHPLYSLVAVCV